MVGAAILCLPQRKAVLWCTREAGLNGLAVVKAGEYGWVPVVRSRNFLLFVHLKERQ